MGRAFLLKTGAFNPDDPLVPLPTRAFPSVAPEVGDLLMVWDNNRGLVAEAPITTLGKAGATIGPVTGYALPIPHSWLDDADRRKTTIRSKIHCDRHDRLWVLTDEDVHHLDATRRFPKEV